MWHFHFCWHVEMFNMTEFSIFRSHWYTDEYRFSNTVIHNYTKLYIISSCKRRENTCNELSSLSCVFCLDKWIVIGVKLGVLILVYFGILIISVCLLRYHYYVKPSRGLKQRYSPSGIQWCWIFVIPTMLIILTKLIPKPWKVSYAET